MKKKSALYKRKTLLTGQKETLMEPKICHSDHGTQTSDTLKKLRSQLHHRLRDHILLRLFSSAFRTFYGSSPPLSSTGVKCASANSLAWSFAQSVCHSFLPRVVSSKIKNYLKWEALISFLGAKKEKNTSEEKTLS